MARKRDIFERASDKIVSTGSGIVGDLKDIIDPQEKRARDKKGAVDSAAKEAANRAATTTGGGETTIPPQEGEIIRDQDTGEPTFIFKGGSYFSVDKEDPNAIAVGAPEAAQTAESQNALNLFQEFRGQPLPPDVLASLSPVDIDAYQALATGGAGAAIGAVGTGVGGAIAGGAVGSAGGPVGAVGGAVLGALAGLITGAAAGIRANVGAQLGGQISAKEGTFERNRTDLGILITNTNQGGPALDNVQSFQEVVTRMRLERAQLKKDTSTFYAKGTGNDGTRMLARYNLFFEQTLPLFEQQMEQAILNPNPNLNLVDLSDLE